MDVGVAEEAVRVYIVQVLENLKVCNQRETGFTLTHLLQVIEVVGYGAPVAQIDIKAKRGIAHLAQLGIDFFEASACGIAAPDPETFLVDLDGTLCISCLFFLADKQRQSIDVAWVAAGALHGDIASALAVRQIPSLDKLDTESLVNTGQCRLFIEFIFDRLRKFVLGDDFSGNFLNFKVS